MKATNYCRISYYTNWKKLKKSAGELNITLNKVGILHMVHYYPSIIIPSIVECNWYENGMCQIRASEPLSIIPSIVECNWYESGMCQMRASEPLSIRIMNIIHRHLYCWSWLGCDRPSWLLFFRARFAFSICTLARVFMRECLWKHARVFMKTLVHEFSIIIPVAVLSGTSFSLCESSE